MDDVSGVGIVLEVFNRDGWCALRGVSVGAMIRENQKDADCLGVIFCVYARFEEMNNSSATCPLVRYCNVSGCIGGIDGSYDAYPLVERLLCVHW